MTRFRLLAAMCADTLEKATITVNEVTGVLDSVQREDGSGNCFNVKLQTKTGPQTVFVRTTD